MNVVLAIGSGISHARPFRQQSCVIEDLGLDVDKPNEILSQVSAGSCGGRKGYILTAALPKFENGLQVTASGSNACPASLEALPAGIG